MVGKTQKNMIRSFTTWTLERGSTGEISVTEGDGEAITVKVGCEEWLVCTYAYATMVAKGRIWDRVWAFRPEFLVHHMPRGMTVDSLRELSGAMCEDAGPVFQSLITAGSGKDAFCSAATNADDRRHFLAGYDHEEHELPGGFFAYRVG